jgi:F-type H+-transporting ATPase subunit c
MNLLVSLLAFVEDAKPSTWAVTDFGLRNGLAAIGAGLCILGGAFGIGRLAAAAMEGMSRQPEAAGEIRGGMILAIITCLLAIFMKGY